MIDINTSKINRIIIHRVFSIKDKNTREINELTELEPNIINFGDNEILMLKNRISKSFSKGSKFFKLQIEESGMGSFFSLASECQKCDDDNFIKKSNRIAYLLAEGHLQRAAIPGGLLLILDGFDENNNYFLMVIKAEPQDAFTLNEHKIEIVKNLFLSPAKEFFKIGLIIDDNTSKSKNINKKFSSWVYDDQFQPTRIDLAVYFYKTFLGFSTECITNLPSREKT